MNKITSPLNSGMTDSAVADLQDALQLFLNRKLVLPDDEGARREASALLQRERAAQFFDKTTKKLVALFQETRHLQPTGAVDEAPQRERQTGRIATNDVGAGRRRMHHRRGSQESDIGQG